MAKVTVYLNFKDEAEKAFNFYKQVFGTEFEDEPTRFEYMPADENAPPLSEKDKKLIMHVALPIYGDFVLMGSDVPESMGPSLTMGNNVHLHLQVDNKNQADKLFNALKEGGKVGMELAEQFWGDYFGDVSDKFGVKWMVSCPA